MKVFTVVVILSLLWSTSMCEHFCQTFLFGGHKLLIYEGKYGDGVLILGNKYWKITEPKHNEYALEADEPLGSNDLLSKYYFAIKLVLDHRNDFIGFYNPTTKTVDQFVLNRTLEVKQKDIKVEPIDVIEDINTTLPSGGSKSVIVSQSWNTINQSFDATFVSYKFTLKRNDLIEVTEKSDANFIHQGYFKDLLAKRYIIVGKLFIDFVLTDNSTVFHCFGNDCQTKFKVIIDCKKWSEQNLTTIPTSSTLIITSTPTKAPPKATTTRMSTNTPMTTTASKTTTTPLTTTTSKSSLKRSSKALVFLCSVVLILLQQIHGKHDTKETKDLDFVDSQKTFEDGSGMSAEFLRAREETEKRLQKLAKSLTQSNSVVYRCAQIPKIAKHN